MILENISVEVFGKLRDRDLTFTPGLNVVVGPNEAGKSTLFHAIEYLLFVPVTLKKRDAENWLTRWFPVSGGDSIAVSGRIASPAAGTAGELRKQWGGNPSLSLTWSGGGVYTSDSSVRDEIGRITGVPVTTFREVCLLRQSTLARTIEELKKNSGVIQDLSDVLEKALFESGGVSVSSFTDNLEARIRSFFAHWDRDRGCPENDRGVNNPWKQQVGVILSHWYSMKEYEQQLSEAEQLDSELRLMDTEIGKLREKIAAAQDFTAVHGEAFISAGKRENLELQVSLAGKELLQYRSDQKAWSDTLVKRDSAARELKEKRAELDTLKEEKSRADERAARQKEIARFEQLRTLKEAMDRSTVQLEAEETISREDAATLRRLQTEAAEIGRALTAGRLNARVSASDEISLSVRTGGGEGEERTLHELSAGDQKDFSSDGRMIFSAGPLEITVYSGTENHAQLEREYNELTGEYSRLCSALRVGSWEEAEKKAGKRQESEGEAQRCRKAYLDVLGDDSYEELAERIGSIGDVSADNQDEVLNRFYSVRSRVQQLEKEHEELSLRAAKFEERYRTEDELIDKMADARSRQKAVETELAALAPVPEGFSSADEFVRHYQARKEEIGGLKSSLHEQEMRKLELVSQLPDISLEELNGKYSAAGDEFKKVRDEGETLLRIEEETRTLLEEIRSRPFGSFIEKAGGYIGELTGKRYGSWNGDMPLPEQLESPDGGTLTFEQLSAGTRDIVALSVRLAMADYFLGNRPGFMLLDDPMVDLDPERQERAARVITEFAERHQCILFTCHPSHADYFTGAGRIELNHL